MALRKIVCLLPNAFFGNEKGGSGLVCAQSHGDGPDGPLLRPLAEAAARSDVAMAAFGGGALCFEVALVPVLGLLLPARLRPLVSGSKGASLTAAACSRFDARMHGVPDVHLRTSRGGSSKATTQAAAAFWVVTSTSS